jgi:hypothetical protein
LTPVSLWNATNSYHGVSLATKLEGSLITGGDKFVYSKLDVPRTKGLTAEGRCHVTPEFLKQPTGEPASDTRIKELVIYMHVRL